MDETMGYRSRQECVRTQRNRCRKASKPEKGRILEEGCALFGIERKSLVRAFARDPDRRKRRRGRKKHYGPELEEPLKEVWLAAQQPCGKRLKKVLRIWPPHYEKRFGPLSRESAEKRLSMSPATMDRLLRPVRARRRKGPCATRSVKVLEGQIPIRTRFQEVEGPGFIEADTVAHCGQTMQGAFLWSLTFTDIWSGWTENRAGWNRSARRVVEAIGDIERSLAFPIEGFDSDNGAEFLNHPLFRCFRDRPTPISFTRSRPYRKNDNAHVEQKQWTHVRQLLGCDRFEDRRLVAPINDLTSQEWRALRNHFLPTMQRVSKSREEGRLRRRHGLPQTPCERLLASPQVLDEDKEQLRREFSALDPFDLQARLEAKLKKILRPLRGQTKTARGAPKAA